MTEISAAATAAPPPPSAALATRPEALLLDFGGVVFATRKRPGGMSEVADRVAEVLARAGHHVPAADLLPVLTGGRTALHDWKNSASRRLAPRELTHREIWGDFFAAPLPAAAREVLVGQAGALQQMVTLTLAEHRLRPGVRELVELADALGVSLGIVSNAHSGRAHRAVMERHGLTGAFGVQVYSDEVGVRKPNPEIIEIAARALGAEPARCWYVGDTYDRDVVAGRRAGAGAVVITRHRHTDEVPFPVADTPDAIFDTPEGLVEALRAAAPPEPGRAESGPAANAGDRPAAHFPAVGDSAVGTPVAQVSATGRPGRGERPSALLLDHGGVISVSRPDDGVRRAFAELLATRLTRAGYALTPDQALAALDDIRAAHKSWKARHELPAAPAPLAAATPPAEHDIGAGVSVHDADVVLGAGDSGRGVVVPEIDATTFWVELAGPVIARAVGGAAGAAPAAATSATGPTTPAVVPDGLRAWLRAEAHALMVAYARAKSVSVVRSGVRVLLRAARAAGVPVAVVSNTVNGRAVREKLDAAGLTEYVGAHVYSDELGRRKPDPEMPATALRALGAEAASAWFVGDKPARDVIAARAAGIGHVVLVRGGSTSDDALAALADDDPARPDHVVDDMAGLAALMGLAPAAPPDSGRSPAGREQDPVPGS
ncbi:HAD family hydrolase [Myceligenerans pegani]|uniref:HAD family hydrolase n=1 Tax=Myceligenerans pegani TaxID=2776917 RepID=A0ABR9MWE6_9MICO|nr:HAD family hydrolase [Myceligenerans sp. TRM 65318]MBE1875720.1 HAD family hydrolase [Myceligenerans sp. TRM 65318]MBE3017991.1 HAD family hydrolase [Myceligenerans sp. TRM 65318]